MTLISGDVYDVLMWGDLVGIKGTDQIVEMTFRFFDVTPTSTRSPAHDDP